MRKLMVFCTAVLVSGSAGAAFTSHGEELPSHPTSSVPYRQVDSARSSDDDTTGAPVHSDQAGNASSSSGSCSIHPNVSKPVSAEALKWGGYEYDWRERNRKLWNEDVGSSVERIKKRREDRRRKQIQGLGASSS